MNFKDLSVNQRIKFLIDDYSQLSQRAFAEKLGVSQSAISSLFSQRENRPGLDMLQKIAIAYPEISTDWLLIGRGPMLKDKEVPPATASVSMDGQLYPLTPEQWYVLKQALIEMTPAQATASVETERMGRTYHLGKEATPGLSYDDRLTMRIAPFDEQDLLEIMNKPESEGGLRHRKNGDKYIVTEYAVRQWFGDKR